MRRRRRLLFTPNRNKLRNSPKVDSKSENDSREGMNTARDRFKGALKDVLEHMSQEEDSDDSIEEALGKGDRRQSNDKKEVYLSDEEAKKALRKSPPRQSYVLKLFDRSVDLSQFQDDSPLYPICRAWMANQPKANYKDMRSSVRDEDWEGGLELPGPEGPPVAKAPALLPEQEAHKDHINLNYLEAPPPSREQLLRLHMPRWAAVKTAWHQHIQLKEARYEGTQEVLNKINLEYQAR